MKIRSNVEPGFSLTEVLVTIAIISIVITPIFITFGNAMKLVQTVSNHVERTILAYNFYDKAHKNFIKNNEASQQLVEKNVQTTFVYNATKISENSCVGKVAENIYLEKITIEWQDRGTQKKDTVTTFYYKPT